MHEINIDKDKNRLYIKIGSMADQAEIEQALKDTEAACSELTPGFDCITDLTDYEVAEPETEEYIHRGQKRLIDAGMSRVVRVRKKFGAAGHFQFDIVSMKLGYRAEDVLTIEEAEELLDKARET